MHGGASLAGAASPRFKTGVHSKHLPVRMVAAYEDALNDPQLLDLNANIALIDARVIDLLGRVDTGESGAGWKAISKAFPDLRKAIWTGDNKEILFSLAEIEALIDQSMNDYAAWSEVGRLLDDRRKHVETKQRIETQGERAVPISELMTFMAAVLSIIQTTVSDKQERVRIADSVERLLAPRSTQVQ